MEHAGKNFPEITVETAPFWEGCKKEQLLIQQCRHCGHYQFYPRLMCTNCMNREVDWIEASGKGKVKTYTIIHRAISEAYMKEAPYVLAIIELEEGPTMMSNVINCDPEKVYIGQEVEVTFEKWSEEVTIPKFSPLSS